jgi:L-ascorbate metabolism protein UlaG (beta-lactamase superfamily)
VRRAVRVTGWVLVAGLLGALGIAYACGAALGPPAPAPVTPEPRSWSPAEVHVAYLGHASVLIGFRGTIILTDPAFYDRIGMRVAGLTIGPRRLVRAALRPEDLPPLDAVIVSHAHMDSLDLPSLRAVAGAPLLVVPRRTRDLVDALGFARVLELDWGERAAVDGVEIEAIPVDHWGKRWPWERWRGYNGYVLSRDGVSLLFASDTAYSEHVGRLGRARGVAAAIIGNGAYDPWIANHASPEQVWRMFEESGARYLVPVHWDTFRLGKEPLGDAMARLLAAAGSAAERVVIRRIGETWTMPAEARER